MVTLATADECIFEVSFLKSPVSYDLAPISLQLWKLAEKGSPSQQIRVFLRCDGTSIGNNHVWVLSSREYVECYLVRSRMLEYFPHVKWLIIWKKHYFTGWKSKKGPLRMHRKQQACLEKTAGLFTLPAKISQSFKGINNVVSEWIDSSLYSGLQMLFCFCMQSFR